MTLNALMPPALPPTSAAGLKASDNSGATPLKSGRAGESKRGSRSFLETLSHVSLRQSNSQPKSTAAKITAEVSAGSGKESPNSAKSSNAANDAQNQPEENGATVSAGVSAFPDSWQALGMTHLRFLEFLTAGDGSFSNETRSQTADGFSPVFLDNLMGYLQPEGQGSPVDGLAGIGPFEQLQAGISPEAARRFLLEQLAAKVATNQGTGGMMGMQSEVNGFWQWMASSPEVALNNPTASLGANGDNLLAALLQMQQSVAAAPAVNADTAGTAGQDAVAYSETIKLNEDLLAKMTLSSLSGESDLPENAKLAENAKMAGAGKDALVPLWTAVDPDSEILSGTPSRPAAENLPSLKLNPDLKTAAEQSANPNLMTAEASTKPADDGYSIKNPVLKVESLSIAEFGSKINPVEGDSKEGSMLFAQDQMPEHLKTLESATRTLEGARSGLTSQTMDQIVQKAVLLLNNDQHEVHIELKPEFLGHIRMQIISESHQVAIKIAAEFPFVKEMLESNLHQLKAELQAQGLRIDSLEVSLAHDSDADGDDLNQKAAEIARLKDLSDKRASDDGRLEKQNQSQNGSGAANGETAIDYFA